MSPRRRKYTGQRRTPGKIGHNQARRKRLQGPGAFGKEEERPRQKRTAMLDVSRDRQFRYYLKEIMDKYKVEESNAAAILATIHSKARMKSINEAKEYVREKTESGSLPEDAMVDILRLLNNFRKWR